MAGQERIDWRLVSGLHRKPLGAFGFFHGQLAVIASFYDDADANLDGSVSWGEALVSHIPRKSLVGRGIEAVVEAALEDATVMGSEMFDTDNMLRMRLYGNNFGNLFSLYGYENPIYSINFTYEIRKRYPGLIEGKTVKRFIVRRFGGPDLSGAIMYR